jgi:hypothetical protein
MVHFRKINNSIEETTFISKQQNNGIAQTKTFFWRHFFPMCFHQEDKLCINAMKKILFKLEDLNHADI